MKNKFIFITTGLMLVLLTLTFGCTETKENNELNKLKEDIKIYGNPIDLNIKLTVLEKEYPKTFNAGSICYLHIQCLEDKKLNCYNEEWIKIVNKECINYFEGFINE